MQNAPDRTPARRPMRRIAIPRDFILSWTDVIWIDRALGRLDEHYAPDVKVHTAYGETYDFDHVILNSVQKMSAFPNGGGGSGEDVIWEERGADGVHQLAPRVQDRHQHRPLDLWRADRAQLGVAHDRALRGAGRQGRRGMAGPRRICGAAVARPRSVRGRRRPGQGVAGHGRGRRHRRRCGAVRRPLSQSRRWRAFRASGRARFAAECDAIQAYYDEVWNRRRFDRVSAYCDGKVVCHGVRFKRAQGIYAYGQESSTCSPSSRTAASRCATSSCATRRNLALRIAAIWVLHGTYSGCRSTGRRRARRQGAGRHTL